MSLESDLTSPRERLNEIGRRFDEQTRRVAADCKGDDLQSALAGIRDFFTRGVTNESFRELLDRDPREALRFYTKGIDLEALVALPWYRRYPLIAWKVLVAAAFRLSPARRIAFAVALASFVVGAAGLIITASRGTAGPIAGVNWWILSFLILLFLLLMELRDKLDLKSDLEVAREIQFGLVPTQPFERNGISICSHMRPANTVGGDYHDIIELQPGSVAVVMGDVAGKGMPAALLMAMLQGSLRTLISAGFRSGELIAKLNDYLCANIPANSLVTLFYGELDTAAGKLRYVNAGHNAPFLIRGDPCCVRLDSNATVLGAFPGLWFDVAGTCMNPGERMLLFTDGIPEASNRNEEEYGEARIEAFLKANHGLPQDALVQSLIQDVLAFCGDSRPRDDMTLMSISRR
jgi:hypothetical protein